MDAEGAKQSEDSPDSPMPVIRGVSRLTWFYGPRRRWYRRIGDPFRVVFAQVRAWSANALLRARGRSEAVVRRSTPDLFSYVAGVLVGALCALLWVGLVFWS